MDSGERFVVIGGPGSGKSALLRYLVIDLLTSRPHLHRSAKRSATGSHVAALPVFRARRASMSGAPASVEAALEGLARSAPTPRRCGLSWAAAFPMSGSFVVDGLGTAGDPDEGGVRRQALEVFLPAQRNLPALVSTRPCGAGRFELANRWSYAGIAAVVHVAADRAGAAVAGRSGPSLAVAPQEGQPRSATSAAPGAADSQVDEPCAR